MSEARVTTLSPPPAGAPSVGKPTAKKRRGGSRRNLMIVGAAVVAVGGGLAWYLLSRPALPPGFAGGNGRLEANQIYVASKYPGRIAQVLFDEGDTVEAGQVVARMDTSALEAQLREAEAQIRAAQQNRVAAQENAVVARTQVAAKQAEYDYARVQFDRSKELVTRGSVSQRESQMDQASMLASKANLAGAKANLASGAAQVEQATSNIAAMRATADRIRAEIKDAVLVAPMRARVETRLAEPGEVLPAGGRVFSLNDLSDVYMYVYLPESVTGKVSLGSEARIVLDAASQYPIRATVAFVSPMAQFTPKTVETAEERHNLTFRVKLQIPKERLRQYEPLVKTGLPGMGYVRYTNAPWPQNLEPKANVPTDLWKPTGASQGAK